MSLVKHTIIDFIEAVDSNKPTPGGGSVSALVATLGTALSGMLGKLTIHKKAFRNRNIDVQKQFHDTLAKIHSSKEILLSLVDKDTEAFNEIMNAFKMSKETETDKLARLHAIEQATIEAIEVPYQVAEESLNVLKQLDTLIQYGNINAISDVGVGILLLSSGIEGALFNIKINLSMLKDNEKRSFYENEVERVQTEQQELKERLIPKIEAKIG
ncbi:MAG: cyclodeaminase/cyclohydrolase family protein [Candidatus Izemoplasma sp.]|nr:cyclodeaminase/cyclohydrolase family protein [Candidatus Izemoplasma sp.]